MRSRMLGGALLLAAAVLPTQQSRASSHREAPFIAKNPKVDGTDFYMFRSYEGQRDGYVTFIANYQPLQAAYGGPNYFTMDPEAIYEIHVDNNGDAQEDITFQFDFDSALAMNGQGIRLPVGPVGNQRMNQVPLSNIGVVSAGASFDADQNVQETYTVKIIRGDRRTGTAEDITAAAGGSATFKKPMDNVGAKTFPDYAAYAAAHVYNVSIPGCTAPAGTMPRVFVGQRREGFAVNLGQVFDVLNFDLDPNTPNANPLGPQDQGGNVIDGASVTSLAIEVPSSCLGENAQDTIIGGWTTASVRQARVINPGATYEQPAREGGPWVQVSRLGMPLVNEVVIGLGDKDHFNAAEPSGDGQFADYVTHPTLPELLEIVFGAAGVSAPNNFPRGDLVAAFLSGVPMVNNTGATLSEMVRLNFGIPATPAAMQNTLGAALCFTRGAGGGVLDLQNQGCDPAGFPNGRRPADDVTDIELRVAMGYLAPTGDASSGGLPIVDGAFIGTAATFQAGFPYLNTPYGGSP
jgi:hypothetical protein